MIKYPVKPSELQLIRPDPIRNQEQEGPVSPEPYSWFIKDFMKLDGTADSESRIQNGWNQEVTGGGGGGGLMMHQVSVKPSASSLVILHFNVN